MQRSNSPLPGRNAQSNARGMPEGGMLKFRIDRRIKKEKNIDILVWHSSQHNQAMTGDFLM